MLNQKILTFRPERLLTQRDFPFISWLIVETRPCLETLSFVKKELYQRAS
jgi:hypothetical protein